MRLFTRAFLRASGGTFGVVATVAVISLLITKATEKSIKAALKDIEEGLRDATADTLSKVAPLKSDPGGPDPCPDGWHGAGADLAQMSEQWCPTCGAED